MKKGLGFLSSFGSFDDHVFHHHPSVQIVPTVHHFPTEQQQLAEVHFCCSSALLRPTRGVKKANFPENLAKHNRSKTEQRDEKPIFIQYFIKHLALQGVPARIFTFSFKAERVDDV